MKRWPTKPLGDFVATKSGSVVPSKYPNEAFDLYSIPAFDSGKPEVRAGNEIGSTKQVVQSRDVLLSRIVPHIRRAWVVGADRGRRLVASGEWLVFRSPQVLPHFLRYFLVGDPFHARFMRTVSGVGGSLLRAKATEVAKINIPVPPLAEQERIVRLLDEADELRRLRTQADRRAEALIPALFHEMFGDLDSNRKNWPMVRFAEIGQARLGKMLDSKQQTGKNKRPYLRNANVQWDRLELDDLLEMDFSEADREEFRLGLGDLLICEGGEVGRAAIWRDELPECYFQKALHRIRLHPSKAIPEFILHMLQAIATANGLRNYIGSATIPHLTGVKLASIRVPLPPLPLQKEFVVHVTDMRAMETQQSASRRRLDELFQSMLHRAFKGGL